MAIITLFITTPFSQYVFNNITWGQLIYSIFILSTLIVITQLEIENRILNSKRPTVKIIPKPRGYRTTLEIYNKGGSATFHAEFRTLWRYPDQWQPSEPYTMCWKSEGEKAVIHKGETKIIEVAEQIYDRNNAPQLQLHYIKYSFGQAGLIIKDWPNTIYLQVSVTSDPILKKPWNNQIYKLFVNPHSSKELIIERETGRLFNNSLCTD